MGVRVHRQYERGYAGVVAGRVREATEKELGLDPAAVALDFGRLSRDNAGEFTDRVFETTRVDEERCTACTGWS